MDKLARIASLNLRKKCVGVEANNIVTLTVCKKVTQTTTTAAAPPPPPPPPLPSFDGSGNHVGVDSTKSSSLVAASGNKRSLTSSSTTSSSCLPPPPPPPPLPQTGAGVRLPTKNKSSTANMASTTNQATNIDMMTLKKAFSTKYKLPTFNWITLKPNQVRGTIFNEFHEEDKILKTIDFSEFEEQFKLSTKPDRSNSPNADNLPMGHQANGSSVGSNNSVGAGATDDSTGATKRFKQNEKTTFLEHNRLRNMAISLRKIGLPTDVVIRCLNTFDTYPLPLDTIEILQRMMPQHKEIEAYQEYERSGKPLDDLTDEDKFLAQMSKVERLDQKLKIMFYMKNLTTNAAGEYIGASPSPDSGLPSRQSDTSSMCGDSNSNYSVATSAGVASVIDTLRAKLINIESASRQLRQSEGMKILLEYILIFGNYLNSSARGLASAPAYGFKLQALDMVMDSKSTQDRTRSLMHFLVDTIMKNLVPKEQGKLDTSGDIDGSANGQQPSKRLLPPGTPMARGLLSTGLHGDDQVRMPYNFDTLLLLLEKAASISLETIVSEVAELEKGMELCLKELQLRGFSHPVNSSSKSSSGAMIDVPNSPSGSPVPRACSPAPLMAGTTNDEAARRLSQFIKSKCGEVNDLKETLRQAQNEFSECAQYFGENPRLIESSSLFSVFFRLLKNFRQCQLDNRLAQKRKFDEELRKQIVQQQAQRASNRKQPNGSRSERSKPAEVNATSPKIKPDTRLLHQEEVSHGTLDFLITGLKVEPYRRADGMRRSKRSDVPVYSYMSP
ncbi:Formin-like protein [Fragariocoptes setiger]|uniref:Formin-like protein n=1 Tax=Fragariocoptes setiger TaxID=1670756 RepID=A0ABQ7S9F1_9ACAR|nr:Formin-like protein [Fragariocoptes setiger]